MKGNIPRSNHTRRCSPIRVLYHIQIDIKGGPLRNQMGTGCGGVREPMMIATGAADSATHHVHNYLLCLHQPCKNRKDIHAGVDREEPRKMMHSSREADCLLTKMEAACEAPKSHANAKQLSPSLS